jgi:hypothetical protein
VGVKKRSRKIKAKNRFVKLIEKGKMKSAWLVIVSARFSKLDADKKRMILESVKMWAELNLEDLKRKESGHK